MLTVVTPATSSRLTTVKRTKAALGLPTDADQNALNSQIDQASQAVADYCRRSFAREAVVETFVACGWQAGVFLARYPVASVTSVTFDGVALTTDDYEVDGDAVYALRRGFRSIFVGARLAVAYSAGYVLPSDDNGAPASTLPASLERATILLVSAYRSSLSRDPLVKSETVEGVGSTSWWVPGGADMLPDPEAERLLRPYRAGPHLG